MTTDENIKLGLDGDSPLKVVMRASIEKMNEDNIGVVSIVFATMNKELAKKHIEDLTANNSNPKIYYMVYSVPLDIELNTLEHYPSIAVFKSDLE